MRILVTGATGYIGGRLIFRLLSAGHDITAVVRHRKRVEDCAWFDRVTVLEADLLRPETLPDSWHDFDAAYYLVHSMYAGKDFASLDRRVVFDFLAKSCFLSIMTSSDNPHRKPVFVVGDDLRSR